MLKYLIASLLAIKAFAVPPAPVANYVPVVIANATTIDASRLYFIAHALDPSGLPCYLVPNASGICQYVYPSPTGYPSSASDSISVSLDQLPVATGCAQPVSDVTYYLLYLPVCSSARAYFSVDHPMYLATILNPAVSREVLDVEDSSITALTDVNYYTLYQDFEFGLVNYNPATNSTATVATTLFLNLSWVDYFCLPMNLAIYSYPSNALNTVQPVAGTPYGASGISREDMITNMTTTFNALSNSAVWNALSVPFYQNPYTDTTSITAIRVLAAKNSISLGAAGNQFQLPAVPVEFFPADYLTGTGSTTAPVWSPPQTNTSFMYKVCNYYSGGTTLSLQVIPAGGVPGFPYTFTMAGNASQYTLTFTYTGGSPPYGVTPPSTMTFQFAGPGGSPAGVTTEQILSGGAWPYTVAATNGNNNSFRDEFTKMISALFCVGQLPLVNYPGTAYPFVVQQKASQDNLGGFAQITIGAGSNSYFQTNASFNSGPWYNAYDEAVHLNLVGKGLVPNNPSYGTAYGYDYDDALNMAGLVQPEVQDAYGNSYTNASSTTQNGPYAMIVLGSLDGTPLDEMNVDNDTYTYSVSLAPALNGLGVEFLYYTSSSSPQRTMVPVAVGNTDPVSVYVDSTHPFQVQFTYNSKTYTYNVNLQRQMAFPLDPAIYPTATYSSVDQQLIEGITFEAPIPFAPSPPAPKPPVVTNPSFLIKVNSTPPQWPG